MPVKHVRRNDRPATVPKSNGPSTHPHVAVILTSPSQVLRMADPPDFATVYGELRRLAAAKLHAEPDGHTLDATALVHEVFLKLDGHTFASRSGFFRAAAAGMRRVLIDHARGKRRQKRGGGRMRVALADIPRQADTDPDLLLSLADALERLAAEDPAAAEVADLHLFAGLPIDDAADALGVSRATAYRNWTFARAWLQEALGQNP